MTVTAVSVFVVLLGPAIWIGVLAVAVGWLVWREHLRDLRAVRRELDEVAVRRSMRPVSGNVENVVCLADRRPGPGATA